MSDEERLKLFTEVKDAIGDDGAVVAGTTDNNTYRSIDLSKEAEAAGVDAILMTVPGLQQTHPRRIGKTLHRHCRSRLNPRNVLYNVPGRTALNMTAATTLKLADVPNIVGVKEASSDADQICLCH